MKRIAITLCLLLVLGVAGCGNTPPADTATPASSPAQEQSGAASDPASDPASGSASGKERKAPEVDSTMLAPSTPQPYTLQELLPDAADATFLVPVTDDYVLLQYKPMDDGSGITVLYSYDEQGDIVGETYKKTLPDEAQVIGSLPDNYEVSRLMADESGWTKDVQAFARVGMTVYKRIFPREIENTYTKRVVFAEVYDEDEGGWQPVEETGYSKFYLSKPIVPAKYSELREPKDELAIFLEPAKLYDTLEDFVNLPTDAQYNFAPKGDDYLRRREIYHSSDKDKVSEELICSFDAGGIVTSESTRIEFASAGAAAAFLSAVTTGPTPGYDQAGNYVYIYKPTPPPAGFGDKYYYLHNGIETYLNLGPIYMSKPYLTPEQLEIVRKEGRLLW